MTPLMRFAMVLMLGAAACASNPNALKAHTSAAETLDDLAGDAKVLVLEDRHAELDAVAESAFTDNATPEELAAAVRAAAKAYDDGPKISAVNTLIAAKDLYVRAVLHAASEDKPSWTEAKAMLKDVIDAYSNLRKLLGEPAAMPKVPEAIAKLLTRRSPRPDVPIEVVA